MIIKDIRGFKLRLSKSKLTEVTGEAVPGEKWYVNLVDLQNQGFSSMQVLYRRPSEEEAAEYGWDPHEELLGWCAYNPRKCQIGCRRFDKETFAVILKAIKETK